MAFEFQDIVNAAQFTPIGIATQIAQGDQPADMQAMNDFMVRTQAKTSKASQLKTEWNAWFNDLSWYEKTMDNDTRMRARNRLVEFELANATSSAEKESVRRIQQQSAKLELERAAQQGKSLPINVDTGKFTVDSPRPDKLKLKWVLLGVTGSVVAGLGAYVTPKGKVPLALTSIASLLATGTYTAFKIEE